MTNKQALREAAEKATPGKWRRASTRFNGITAQSAYPLCGKEDILANAAEKRDAEFIAAANPATVLALLDEISELEQRHCGTALLEREEAHAKTVGRLMDELEAKDKRIAELESERDKQGRHACELFDEVNSQRQQIAELVAAGIITRIED